MWEFATGFEPHSDNPVPRDLGGPWESSAFILRHSWGPRADYSGCRPCNTLELFLGPFSHVQFHRTLAQNPKRRLAQLSQLQTFFGYFALIFVVKACVFIGALPENGRVETQCLPFGNGLLAVCRQHVSAQQPSQKRRSGSSLLQHCRKPSQRFWQNGAANRSLSRRNLTTNNKQRGASRCRCLIKSSKSMRT